MPRFFFNIRRGDVLIPDNEGDELLDLEAAQALAAETVREMWKLPHVYGPPREWQRDVFVISDEHGRQLLELPLVDLASDEQT